MVGGIVHLQKWINEFMDFFLTSHDELKDDFALELCCPLTNEVQNNISQNPLIFS